jgi:NAD(P)-dependent dehydrogenase (short-subunit alcohol dehydrogenase family)
MDRNVLVTGADRGLGFSLCAELLERGWIVYAGQFMPEWPDLDALQGRFPGTLHVVPLDVGSGASVQAAAQSVDESTDHIDLLISNAGISAQGGRNPIREAQDYAAMLHVYDVNALGALRVVEAFLPLCDRGAMKRLCFVSSEAGSIERSTRTAGYGYCMSKAALNMATKIMFNDLHPQGYTFRVYYPGWLRTYMSGVKSTQANLEPEEGAALAIPLFLADREDEDHLVMIDYQGREWPW